jgi:putative glycosyltransferase (TIGR04372 family)
MTAAKQSYARTIALHWRKRLSSARQQFLAAKYGGSPAAVGAKRLKLPRAMLKLVPASLWKRSRLVDPDDNEALISLIHYLYDQRREYEARAELDIDPYLVEWRWRLLGIFIRARFRDDGTVSNIEQLSRIFGAPISKCLTVMARARLRAELAIGILGDEAEFVRLLGVAQRTRKALLSCLGMKRAPVRYMGNYWVRKVGHLGQIEFYFRPLQLGLLGKHRPVILVKDPTEVANACLLDYWKTRIEVIANSGEFDRRCLEARILEIDIHLFEGGNGSAGLHYKEAAAIAWDRWEASGRGALFTIREEHRNDGWDLLKKAGIPDGSWFVAFHAREPGFAGDPFPSPRNASIENFLPAMQEVVARGGWVIRIGDKDMKRLPAMPGVVDYAHSDFKSDWMDIFLLAQCRFFVSTPSGPAQVPHLFGVPTVYTNWIPMADYPFHGEALLIHKTHRDSNTGSKIPYPGFLSLRTDYSNINARNNIMVEENTAEEIREVVVEMLDHLEGKQPPLSPEDERRLARFHALAGMKERSRPVLGRAFLQANADLLGPLA